MIYILIGIVGAWLWIWYEAKNAPFYDEQTNKFYKDYDAYKHDTTEGIDDEAPNSGAQRDKKSTKRGKKTKGN